MYPRLLMQYAQKDEGNAHSGCHGGQLSAAEETLEQCDRSGDPADDSREFEEA